MGWLKEQVKSWGIHFVLSLMGAAAVAYLKTKASTLVEPLMYGLSAFVLLNVGFAALRVSTYFRTASPIRPRCRSLARRVTM